MRPKHQNELPQLIELIHNVSFVFLNTHSALEFARPLAPSLIEIGGLHIQSETKMSPDIAQFINDAKIGVIYFSLGGSMKSYDLPPEKREIFTTVFGSLTDVRVIWKWENATLQNQPGNVIIGPWLPQQDLLSHPNVKLFITNGGSFSMLEAVHFAVPVIGIPMCGEQNLNIARAVHNGYAHFLDYDNLTEYTLRKTIEEVLYNPM